MAGHREEKINEEIKRALTSVIRELKDPRLSSGMVSILKADVTKDLKFCKVYISVLGNEESKNEIKKGLESAKGFIKKEISARVKLRAVPELIFTIDNSIEEGDRILKIMENLKQCGEHGAESDEK